MCLTMPFTFLEVCVEAM